MNYFYVKDILDRFIISRMELEGKALKIEIGFLCYIFVNFCVQHINKDLRKEQKYCPKEDANMYPCYRYEVFKHMIRMWLETEEPHKYFTPVELLGGMINE